MMTREERDMMAVEHQLQLIRLFGEVIRLLREIRNELKEIKP